MKPDSSAPRQQPGGDMPAPEFREMGHRVIDWIADYLLEVERYPVLAKVKPGDISLQLSMKAPEGPTPMVRLLNDFEEQLIPGITHWNHPGFLAYFGITASGPGIIGELLSAGLNVNAMLWRTSPSATELEDRVLDWLRQMLNLPPIFRGHLQDTASLSTLVALTAARERGGSSIREKGLTGRGLPTMRIYCSAEAHSSVEKAAITLGLGLNGVRRVTVDGDFRMDVGELEHAIASDRAEGVLPLAVVATAGTTSTTSIDPIGSVAEVCHRHRLWLHVDAAYGGAAAVMPEMRSLFDGIAAADSIVINPHKWLFVPIDCSALYLRDPDAVRRAFSVIPHYLASEEGPGVINLMDYGPALGRRFRALKLWMVLRYFGREGIAARLREHVRLAREFASWVDADTEWERPAPVPLSVVCFRWRPPGVAEAELDALNAQIVERVNASGEVFLSTTRLAGSYVIRIAIGNVRTGETHVARAWQLLRESASVLA